MGDDTGVASFGIAIVNGAHIHRGWADGVETHTRAISVSVTISAEFTLIIGGRGDGHRPTWCRVQI